MMDLNDLKKRAGIVNEAADPGQLWREFSRLSDQLAQTLARTSIDTQGGGKAPEGMLNPLQVNDIEYSLKKVQEQLDRLDQVYQWRKYMEQRKARMKVT